MISPVNILFLSKSLWRHLQRNNFRLPRSLKDISKTSCEFSSRRLQGVFKTWKTTNVCWIINIGDYPLSTYAKFSDKLTSLTPWYAHVGVRIRGLEMSVFRKILLTYLMDDSLISIWSNMINKFDRKSLQMSQENFATKMFL